MPRFDWHLDVTIPLVDKYGLLEEDIFATGTITTPDEMSAADIQAWLIHKVAKEYAGRAMTVTRFVLTEAA